MPVRRWTDDEKRIIREQWTTGESVTTWAHLLPGRKVAAIHSQARNALFLGPLKANRSAMLEAMRAFMRASPAP